MVKKRISENIFGNYLMNYLTEFDLYLDIVLIEYMFCAKTLFFKVDLRRLQKTEMSKEV